MMRRRVQAGGQEKDPARAPFTRAGLLSIPAERAIRLYGLEGQAKGIVEGARSAEEHHPKAGKLIGFVSWSALNLALVQMGSALTDALRLFGDIASTAAGYTLAFVHPSCISLIAKRGMPREKRRPGVAEYLQARVLPAIFTYPVLFGTLSYAIHSIRSDRVGMLQGVGAVLLSSFMSLVSWNMAFSLYWPKVIRKEKGEGLLRNAGSFLRGMASRGPAQCAHEEAGRLARALNLFYVPLAFSARAAAAVCAVLSGSAPADFVRSWSGFFALLSVFDVIGRGIETEKAGEILKEGKR